MLLCFFANTFEHCFLWTCDINSQMLTEGKKKAYLCILLRWDDCGRKMFTIGVRLPHVCNSVFKISLEVGAAVPLRGCQRDAARWVCTLRRGGDRVLVLFEIQQGKIVFVYAWAWIESCLQCRRQEMLFLFFTDCGLYNKIFHIYIQIHEQMSCESFYSVAMFYVCFLMQ